MHESLVGAILPESIAVAGGDTVNLSSRLEVPTGTRLVGGVRASKALTLIVFQNPCGDSWLIKTEVSIGASEAEGGGTKIDIPLTSDQIKIALANGGTPTTDDTVAYASLFFKKVDAEPFEPALAASLPTGIDAAKIGSGDVSNTEFGYLNGVSSAIQTQLDAKVAIPGSSAAGDILYHDGSGYVRLAKGTAGQALVMNAGATAPEWATLE